MHLDIETNEMRLDIETDEKGLNLAKVNCPKCGSRYVSMVSLPTYGAVAVIHVNTCTDCKHSWKKTWIGPTWQYIMNKDNRCG